MGEQAFYSENWDVLSICIYAAQNTLEKQA